MDETTREYYRKNAQFYFDTTKDAFVPSTIKAFLDALPVGGTILDFGCGSGRDSKYFLERGYQVTPLDGCAELAALAEEFIGQPVVLSDFFSYQPTLLFDGIWSQASLVHLKKEETKEILTRMAGWLKKDGIAVISLRYGDFSGYRDGRYYTYWTEESFQEILQGSGLQLAKTYLTHDVRPGVDNDWLNFIITKSHD